MWKMDGNAESQQKVNSEEGKMEENVKAWKRAQKSRVTRGKQTPNGGNQERDTENTFRSVQDVQNRKSCMNRIFVGHLKMRGKRGSEGENSLEQGREGRIFGLGEVRE